MEEKCKEVHDNVLEVQTTYRFVLKRLNQVVQNSSGPSCECGSAAQLQDCLSEIEILSSRIQTLEEEDSEMDQLLTVLLDQLKSLQNSYAETIVGSVGSDVSNVKSDNVTYSTDAYINGKPTVETETTSNVTINEKSTNSCKTVASGINAECMNTASVTGNTEAAITAITVDDINTVCGIDDTEVEDECNAIASGTTVDDMTTASASDNTEDLCTRHSTRHSDNIPTKKSVIFNEKVTQKLLRAESEAVSSGKCEDVRSDAGVSDIVEVSLNDTLRGASGGRTDWRRNPTHGRHQEQFIEADMEDLPNTTEMSAFHNERLENDTYHEEIRSNLPMIGSRVRRGPDWKYGDQDSGGPGTIVGHAKGSMQCFVNWDLNGAIDLCSYGKNGKYDIILVDEQRYLQPGEYIAVGCEVRPGLGWKWSFDDISKEDLRGVVLCLWLEVGDIAKARVRWQNGQHGFYTYQHDEQDPEVIVCYETLQYLPPQPMRKNTTINKNKNVR